MAKVSFSKLGLKAAAAEPKIIEFNGQQIEVKQYLPIQEKLNLIGRVLEQAHDQDNDFQNPVKCKVILTMEIIYAYTNITFTDKQKEDITKLFDLVDSSGLVDTIFEAIPEYELNTLEDGVTDTTEAYYKYRNSIFGILDNLKQNYSEVSFDVNSLFKELQNSENVGLLKEVLTKLG